MKNASRKSNFEIMRILAIFLIVSFHCAFHSGFEYNTFSANVFVVKSFYLFGELGVNLFFLLSGYFQINGKFKPRKVVLLFAELIFYTVLSNVAAAFIKGDFSVILRVMVKNIIVPYYWFFTVYVIIYIFSPFINSFLKSISKYRLAVFLFLSFAVFSVLPTLFGFVSDGNTEKYYFFNRLIWGLIIYSTGAYISLNKETVWRSTKKNFITAVLSFAVMLCSIIIIGKVGLFAKIGLTEPAFFWQLNTVPMVLLSVSVFNLFRSWNISKPSAIINSVASTTLGIYLLSEGELRSVVLNGFLNSKEQLSRSPLYSLLFLIVVPVAVIIIGAVVDLIRQIIEKYIIVKLLNANRIDYKKPFKKAVEKIFN